MFQENKCHSWEIPQRIKDIFKNIWSKKFEKKTTHLIVEIKDLKQVCLKINLTQQRRG